MSPMNKMIRLMESGMAQCQSGDLKGACDKFIAAVLAAPKASFTLGVLESDRNDREEAADYCREGLLIAKEASAQDKKRVVQSDTGPFSVAELIDMVTESLSGNLGILSGTGSHTPIYNAPRDYGDRGAMPPVGQTISMRVGGAKTNMSADDLIQLTQRAMVVGGNACDSCERTLKDVDLDKLNCCARCKLVYYCSTPCQRKAWKAGGHKQACRIPNEIVPADYMLLVDLVPKPELNGKIVRVKQAATSEGRWMAVEVNQDASSALYIATKNLRHIRPAK